MALLVNAITSGSAGGSVTTPARNTTGAKFIVCLVNNFGSAAAATFADSLANTWTAGTARDVAGGSGPRHRIYYCINPIVGATHTFTATQVGTGYPTVVMAAFDDAVSVVDQNSWNTQSTAPCTTGSITPTENGELLISSFSGWWTSATSVDNGFTLTDQHPFSSGVEFNSALAYKYQVTAAAINPGWATGSQQSGAEVHSFKIAAPSSVDYPYSVTMGLVAGGVAPVTYGRIPATSGVAAILGGVGALAASAIPLTGTALVVGAPSGLTGGSTTGTVMGPVVLVSVFLDSGTEYAAATEIRHPSRLYEGRVIACGTVERSIPIPVGLPSVGNLTITFADSDHYWRGVLSQRTPYRRLLEVKIGVEGGSEVLFMTAYRGEIRSVHFEQENVSIEAADITARWLDNPIPPLINRINFPNSAVADAFFPIVLGGVTDPRIPPTGAVRCYLIDTTLNRYSVSRTPSTVLALYKKISGSTLSPAVSGDVWVLIDPADYTVSEINQTIDGVDYDYTVADLAVSIDTGSPVVYGGTEVRADINGTQGRGAFGSMPGVTGTLRNPIDALINMSYYGFLAANQVVRFDTESFETVHAQMEELAWYCDGAIVDPMTFREFLGQFLPCFSLDLYQNRRAELAVKLTQGGDPDRPVFNDLDHILRGSVRQDLPDPCYNRIVYKWGKIYSDNHFENTTVFNNEEDQAETILADEDPPTPKIQSETVELHFIRDADTAIATMGERSLYQSLASYRFHCDLSAPQVLNVVDLATRIGITHAGGIAPGGWVNEEFKVYRESLNLDDLRLTISGIRRPVPPSAGSFIPAAWSHNARPGPWYVNPKTLYLALQPNADRSTLNIYKSADWGETWTVADSFNATNEIISFDVEQDPSTTTLLHVAIQELVTGRVSYHEFSMSTDAWTVADEEIAATVTHTDLVNVGNVSIAVRKTSLEAVVAFEGDQSSGDRRWKYVRRTGVATYTAAADVSGTSAGNDIGGGRVIAGAEDRVHFFYFRQPMLNLLTGRGDLCSKTLSAANVLSSENAWQEPASSAFDSAVFPLGDYCVFDAEGSKIAVIYRGNFGAPVVAVFTDADDLTGMMSDEEYVGTAPAYMSEGTYDAQCPQGIVRYVRGQLRIAWSRFTAVGGPGWVDYRHTAGAEVPSAITEQISPYFPRFSTEPQGFSAAIYPYGSDLYFAELIYCDGPGAGLPEPFGCVFFLGKASTFPLDDTYTINDWADEFLS